MDICQLHCYLFFCVFLLEREDRGAQGSRPVGSKVVAALWPHACGHGWLTGTTAQCLLMQVLCMPGWLCLEQWAAEQVLG